MGGGDLADRVPGEEVGLQAALGQSLVEGDLDREEGGLGVGGVARAAPPPCLPSAKTISFSGALQVGVELGADFVEGLGEAGSARRAPCPSGALGALAGEEEGELARPWPWR